MEYLILNEESIPFSSKSDCNAYLPEFLNILTKSFQVLQCVRISDNIDAGWYNLEIAQSYYLRDWIKTLEYDYKIKLKTIIEKTKTPQIPISNIDIIEKTELSEFSLKTNEDIKTPSLGIAYLINQIAISFQSKSFWNSSKIELNRMILNNEGDFDIQNCEASNITQMSHWEIYLKIIKEERKESCRKGITFWENRESEFVNLIFCKSTEKQFKKLNINSATYNSLWDNLRELNDNICNCSSAFELKKEINLTFTDESDCVKNNPRLRRRREFSLPNGSKKYFGFHTKNFPGSFRLYFYPVFNKNLIYIGYFGKHLPTCKNP